MNFCIEKNKIKWSYMGEYVWIEACGPESVRVRASFRSPIDESRNYNLLLEKEQEAKTELKENGDAELVCGNLKVQISSKGKLTFFYRGKKILKEEWIDEENYMPVYQKGREYKGNIGNTFLIQTFFEANPGEHIYGMGQEYTGCFDRMGTVVELCQKNTKCTIPFYLSSLGYGFLWNHPGIGKAEFGRNHFVWDAKSAVQLDYIVIGGGNPKSVLENYTYLTGRMPDVPEWIWGLWQSKLRYKSQDEILEVAEEYKKRKLPVSVLILDYFHWKYQGDWKMDSRYFPEPKKMTQKLKDMGIRLMASVWPTVDRRGATYTLLEEEGGLITAERGPNVFFMCRGAETYVDMTNDRAADILFEKLKENYIENGITSFWLDEAEPEIYPYDYDNMRMKMGNGLEMSCFYPYAYNSQIEQRLYQTVWKEKENEMEEDDGIILVRSGWIGSQKLRSVLWSGDIPSTFESLRRQVQEGLEVAMCGIVLWTTDIGGFCGGDPEDPEFRELMIRWFQFGVYSPILRMHGYRMPYENYGNMDDMSGECNSGGPNELWSFGEEAYQIMKDYLELRQTLIPYIKEQVKEAQKTGAPIMRPLFYDFPEDEATWGISDEYMFGEEILVAPVLHYGERNRKVYLPKGAKWKTDTGDILPGGTLIEAEAPLEKIPVFYKTL